MANIFRSSASLRQANPHAFDFIPPAKHQKILDHTSDYDAAPDLQRGLDQAKGRRFDIPGGQFVCAKPVVQKIGTQIYGGGTQERAANNSPKTGTRIVPPPSIAGYPGSRWFDVNGSDPTDYKPLWVVGGPNCGLHDIAFEQPRTGVNRLDCGLFIATVYKTGLYNVQTLGGWKDAGCRIDNTGSPLNTTLTALHPEIIYSGGNQELTTIDCNFVGIRGLRIQGTTRNPDDYPVASDWVWGYAGGSDLTFVGTRFDNSNTEGNVGEQDVWGAPIFIDSATKSNATNTIQGQRFIGCNFRSDDSKYTIRLNRANRVEFIACYAECEDDPSTPNRFEITSNTGNVTILGGDYAKLRWWKNDVDSGVSCYEPPPTNNSNNNYNYDNITFLNNAGKFKLPILRTSDAQIGEFYRSSNNVLQRQS